LPADARTAAAIAAIDLGCDDDPAASVDVDNK
jgi:hypothetical protein